MIRHEILRMPKSSVSACPCRFRVTWAIGSAQRPCCRASAGSAKQLICPAAKWRFRGRQTTELHECKVTIMITVVTLMIYYGYSDAWIAWLIMLIVVGPSMGHLQSSWWNGHRGTWFDCFPKSQEFVRCDAGNISCPSIPSFGVVTPRLVCRL